MNSITFALTVGVAAAALIGSPAVLAQSRQIPAAQQSAPVVIHSTTIHTVAGDTIENGYIVFENGVITRIGEGNRPRIAGATAQDASGLHVYPGLVAAATSLGLTETGAVDVTNDYSELGRVTPEVRAAVAINPDTDLIPVTRANGILLAGVFPRGGLISGRASTIRLDGWTWEDLAIDSAAGLVVNWPRTEPVTAWWMQESEEAQRKSIKEDLKRVETVIDDALAYIKAKDNDPDLNTDLRYEAMRASLTGEKPLFVNASSMGQIESAVAWAVRRGLKIVIVGGNDADQVTTLLVEHNIPVIIGGIHRVPGGRHLAYDQAFTLPNTLHEAGVRFCIASSTGSSAAHERNLNHHAATAAAYGLPKHEALRAVTQSPADILGLGATYGTLEMGKSATLIVTSGDPLEITTDVLIAYVDGRRIDLGSRHKALHTKYRTKYKQLGLIE